MSAVTQQQQQHTTSNGADHASGSQEPKQVLTQEVGWLFAKEYYKFMNSDPEMLHEFYGKKSISICGVEGEPVPQAKGQQEIRTMISGNEFKGRKVLVTNVDALPAISGSIMVQVIGQMDTKDCEGYLRFVHTFLLAEQQGGYYIHNDILRYLNEDYEDRETTAVSESDPAAPVAAAPVENVKKDEKVDADDDLKINPEIAQEAAAADKTEPTVAVEAAVPAAEVKAAVAEAIAENIVPDVAPAAVDAPKAESKPESKPKTKAPKEKPAAAAAAAPADVAPKAEQKSAAPPKSQTWANLAANQTNKWKDNTIAKVEGTVAQAPASHTSSGISSGAAASSDPSSRVSTPASGARESYRGIKNEALSVFIKSVPTGTPIMTIKNAFKKFGPVGYVDYATHKTTGVVEFSTEEGKQAALNAASINIGNNNIIIEQRRPRTQPAGRRDGGVAKQQGSGTLPRNGSGDFERVGSSRGSRGRAPTASSTNTGANVNGARPRGSKQ